MTPRASIATLIARTRQLIVCFISCAFIALTAVACEGAKVDGQHEPCASDADCRSNHALECRVSTQAGDRTCEIPCSGEEGVPPECPSDQSCVESEAKTLFCYGVIL